MATQVSPLASKSGREVVDSNLQSTVQGTNQSLLAVETPEENPALFKSVSVVPVTIPLYPGMDEIVLKLAIGSVGAWSNTK